MSMQVTASLNENAERGLVIRNVYRFEASIPARRTDWVTLCEGLKDFSGTVDLISPSSPPDARKDQTVFAPGMAEVIFVQVDKVDNVFIYKFDLHRIDNEPLEATLARTTKTILHYYRG